MSTPAAVSPNHCSVCRVDCPDPTSLVAHIRGKKHINNINGTTQTSYPPTISETAVFVKCVICDRELGGGAEGWRSHVKSKHHKSRAVKIPGYITPAYDNLPKIRKQQHNNQTQTAQQHQTPKQSKWQRNKRMCPTCHANVMADNWDRHLHSKLHRNNLSAIFAKSSRLQPPPVSNPAASSVLLQHLPISFQAGAPSSQSGPSLQVHFKQCEECDRMISLVGWDGHIQSPTHKKNAAQPTHLPSQAEPPAQHSSFNVFTSQKATQNNAIVPGIRSPHLESIVWSTLGLGVFPIPQDIEAIFETGTHSMQEILEQVGVRVPGVLSSRTYEDFWRTLLFVEEIRLRTDLRQYDMYGVHLYKHGLYYHLKAPQLIQQRGYTLLGMSLCVRACGAFSAASFQGFVHYVQGGDVGLRFDPSFVWKQGQLYDVELQMYGENVRRMHHALSMATLGEDRRRILSPQFEDFETVLSITKLEIEAVEVHLTNKMILTNARQLWAVAAIRERRYGSPPLVIFGPPGTGKTTVLVEAVRQLVLRDPRARVLVCTPSDSAADKIALQLLNLGNRALFRLNASKRPKTQLPPGLIPFSYVKHVKSRYPPDSDFSGEVNDGLDFFACPPPDVLMNYRVVVSTCLESHALMVAGVPRGHFFHIMIGSAEGGLEPEVMIPIKTMAGSSTNIILFGDPQQIGPVVRSPIAKEFDFGKSYIERLVELPFYDGETTPPGVAIVKLTRNFTSHPAILKFPSDNYYNGELVSHGNYQIINSLQDWSELPTKGFPIIFHSVHGDCCQDGLNFSYFNPTEASVVKSYVQWLRLMGLANSDIGIISPFRSQRDNLRALLSAVSSNEVCSISSIEEFRNQKRKAIIVSTVRSKQDQGKFNKMEYLDLISQPHHLNMTITRAQALLIVVGDPSVLGHDPQWREFLNYVYLGGGWRGPDIEWDPEDDYDSEEASDSDSEER